jgi:hypothetical protein
VLRRRARAWRLGAFLYRPLREQDKSPSIGAHNEYPGNCTPSAFTGLSLRRVAVTAAKTPASRYVTITAHVPREAGETIQRLAEERGVSVSACAAALLGEALRASVEHEHGALLEAVVERTIRQCLWAHVERLNDLAARAALYGDEGRRMTFQVLVNALGPDRARAFRREIHSAAYQRLKEPLEPPAPNENGAWPAARIPS